MGRVVAVNDNAAVESFFSLLQTNMLDRPWWTTRQELRLAIVPWVEGKITVSAGNEVWGQWRLGSSRLQYSRLPLWQQKSLVSPKPSGEPCKYCRH